VTAQNLFEKPLDQAEKLLEKAFNQTAEVDEPVSEGIPAVGGWS